MNTVASSFLPEIDEEYAVTRRLLERYPADRGAWTPHAKSSSLGDLAAHVAQIPTWLGAVIERDELDAAALDGHGESLLAPWPHASSARELVARFDAAVAAARAQLAAADDPHMRRTWTLRAGATTIFSEPRAAVVRSFVLNHGIHHRGQLTVYYRLLDVPLPSSYGPTADEPM